MNVRLPDSARAAVTATLGSLPDLTGALPDTDVRPYLDHGSKLLRNPEFTVTAPESYRAAADGRPLERPAVPMVWTLPDGHPGLRYGPERITALTPGAHAALAAFETQVAGMDGTPVLVQAGGFHIFDNRRVMHRRVPFEPAAPDRARWLRRCYALGQIPVTGSAQ
ncbi:TauD/TfdA family dioxygenase [Kitasatospora sp. MAP5-34]|uniref:TauD/TfdA family dioxygenase n=1 Tax=Kitasatospora sp. MAP5-34 TaxID=3035102 RepID=UPI0024747CF1|nr:TauD/TfdA family dioxygenase [Kitasatospora sp. MAP5-34]MDH6579466.1 hypothetical protein [Kitasatospora sp. MAP5-34]